MTVFMKTSEGSAVGMPLSFYVLAVLPLQLLWFGTRVLVLTLVVLNVGVFVVGSGLVRVALALADDLREHEAVPGE